jgi:hypothetical protein
MPSPISCNFIGKFFQGRSAKGSIRPKGRIDRGMHCPGDQKFQGHIVWVFIAPSPREGLTFKKEKKIFRIYCIRKFRKDQVQSHEEGLPNTEGNAQIFSHI